MKKIVPSEAQIKALAGLYAEGHMSVGGGYCDPTTSVLIRNKWVSVVPGSKFTYPNGSGGELWTLNNEGLDALIRGLLKLSRRRETPLGPAPHREPPK